MNFFDPKKSKLVTLTCDSWYNVSTGRINMKKYHKYLYLENPKICGTQSDIDEFIKVNSLTPSVENPEICIRNKESSIVEIPYEKICCLFPWKRKKIRKAKKCDVCSLSEDDMKFLTQFSYSCVKCKAKVVNIIDGDTYDIIFFVSSECLLDYSSQKEAGKLGQRIIPKGKACGFFVKERCRLNGIDTAEKNTPEGKEAKRLVEQIIHEHGDIVYVYLMERDKYGRVLADFYLNELDVGTWSKSFNQHLVDYESPIGRVTCLYGGGTKTPETFDRK